MNYESRDRNIEQEKHIQLYQHFNEQQGKKNKKQLIYLYYSYILHNTTNLLDLQLKDKHLYSTFNHLLEQFNQQRGIYLIKKTKTSSEKDTQNNKKNDKMFQ
ncbi:hypothetical protein pb186bvf_003560 [Paramecium bursaria]